MKDATSIEKELNNYPVQGFRFNVTCCNTFTALGSITPIVHADIAATFLPDAVYDTVEIVSWFYLALTDYAEKTRARVTIAIDYDSYLGITAHLETKV